MSLPIAVVDAFTDQAFRGNPACVCQLPEEKPASFLQAIAAEMNLAETAFLLPQGDDFSLRWFTPTVEVDLCGHATLASAYRLWQLGYPKPEIRFHTRSGILTAKQVGSLICLDFPALPVQPRPTPKALFDALHLPLGESYWTGSDWLIEVSADTLLQLHPNFSALASVPGRGLIVTAKSTETEYDFLSRFFAPQSGIDEDPVTGSTHCALIHYWAPKLQKQQLIGYQASKRGGIVQVQLQGDRALLFGKAITTWEGNFLIEN